MPKIPRDAIKQIGQVLRAAREREGVSVAIVSEACQLAYSTYYELERGKIVLPPIGGLQKALEFFRAHLSPKNKAMIRSYIEAAQEFPKPPKGQTERWKETAYPGVSVSDLGRIVRKRYGYALLKSPFKNGKGYDLVSASSGNPVLVGRLVLKTFKGDPPNAGYATLHVDGDRHNNRLDNLAWGPQMHTKTNRGTPHQRLSHEAIREIHAAPIQPHLPETLQAKYGASIETIRSIRAGNVHAEITGGQPRPRRQGGETVTTFAGRLLRALDHSPVTAKALLGAAGITRWTYRQISTGKTLPTKAQVEAIAKALNTPLEYLRDADPAYQPGGQPPKPTAPAPQPKKKKKPPTPKAPAAIIDAANTMLTRLRQNAETLATGLQDAQRHFDTCKEDLAKTQQRIEETEAWIQANGGVPEKEKEKAQPEKRTVIWEDDFDDEDDSSAWDDSENDEEEPATPGGWISRENQRDFEKLREAAKVSSRGHYLRLLFSDPSDVARVIRALIKPEDMPTLAEGSNEYHLREGSFSYQHNLVLLFKPRRGRGSSMVKLVDEITEAIKGTRFTLQSCQVVPVPCAGCSHALLFKHRYSCAKKHKRPDPRHSTCSAFEPQEFVRI